jgi:hypothetical protein
MADNKNSLQIGSSDQLSRTDDLMWGLMRQLNEITGVREIFSEAVKELDLRLTPGAILMLMIPLLEAAKLQETFTDVYRMIPPPQLLSVGKDLAVSSLSRLLLDVQESPSAADNQLQLYLKAQGYPFASSLSVIKAFWKNFCNIPPFCGEPDRR